MLTKIYLFDYKNSNVKFYHLKYIFNFLKFEFEISLMQSWFSASLLQSSVLHDPSEGILMCWFDAQETLLNNYMLNNFCGNWETFL